MPPTLYRLTNQALALYAMQDEKLRVMSFERIIGLQSVMKCPNGGCMIECDGEIRHNGRLIATVIREVIP